VPIITMKIAKGRSVDQKRSLVKAITHAVVNTIEVKEEWVTVLIEEYERENWATGGELHSDTFGPGCGKKNKQVQQKS
jgi:4-oxalocrotonate tautomerase